MNEATAVPRPRRWRAWLWKLPLAFVAFSVLQVLVLATSVVVGWSMLIVGAIFVVLWFLAVRNGRRVDAFRTQGDNSPQGDSRH